MPVPTVLLTGFEPFDGNQTNPSQQVVERLDRQIIGGASVVGMVLPVVFGEDTARVFPLIQDMKPDLVLSLGLAAGATAIWVERIALNLRRPEEGGYQDAPIIPDGPAAYFATLDTEAVSRAINTGGVPAFPHVYAGNYLCNHILYQSLHFAATQGLPYRAGFLHLPLSTEQVVAEGRVQQPSLPLEAIVSGVTAAIAAALGVSG